jgi:starvation-inducible DNA-binding protein
MRKTSASKASSIFEPISKEEEFKTGLSMSYRQQIAEQLSGILSDSYRLLIKSHIYHWNVVGPMFKPLHELTETHYKSLFDAIDVIAERIRSVGHLAPNRMGDIATFSPKPANIAALSAHDIVDDLIVSHESAVRTMRKAARLANDNDDLATADMLTDRLAFHEKAIWMLKAIAAA